MHCPAVNAGSALFQGRGDLFIRQGIALILSLMTSTIMAFSRAAVVPFGPRGQRNFKRIQSLRGLDIFFRHRREMVDGAGQTPRPGFSAKGG